MADLNSLILLDQHGDSQPTRSIWIESTCGDSLGIPDPFRSLPTRSHLDLKLTSQAVPYQINNTNTIMIYLPCFPEIKTWLTPNFQQKKSTRSYFKGIGENIYFKRNVSFY